MNIPKPPQSQHSNRETPASSHRLHALYRPFPGIVVRYARRIKPPKAPCRQLLTPDPWPLIPHFSDIYSEKCHRQRGSYGTNPTPNHQPPTTRIPNPRLLLIPFFFLCLVFAGCGSKVRNTAFLEGGYESFNTINKKDYKLRLTPEAIGTPRTSDADDATSRPVLFIVAEPTWRSAYPYNDGLREERILFTIRERAYRYLLRAYPHPTRVRYAVRRDDPLTQSHRPIVITAHVTDYKLGSGILRYLIGWTAGETRLQIEGEIFEGLDRQRKIGEYAFRVAHAGYAQNGLNPAVLKSDYCLRYAADKGLVHFTEKLAMHLPGVDYTPPEQLAARQQSHNIPHSLGD